MVSSKKTHKKKAIFLDRDGVLIKERGDYTYLMKDVHINKGVIPFLQEMQKRKYLLIIISNQGGIPQGFFSMDDVEHIHEYITTLFSESGVSLTDIYYCPHHQKHGNCLCRKPDSLMIEKAISYHNIDAASSYMIGDTQRDIDAAIKAGVQPIKIEANENLKTILKKIT